MTAAARLERKVQQATAKLGAMVKATFRHGRGKHAYVCELDCSEAERHLRALTAQLGKAKTPAAAARVLDEFLAQAD